MRNHTSRRTWAVGAGAVLAASTIVLSGCTGTTPADETVSSISIDSGVSGDITKNFNPFSPTVLQSTLGVVYEALYFYNPLSTDDPVPMLATGYSWNGEGTELTVNIRDGVTFSDGEALTADDVEYTFDLLEENAAINTVSYTGSATATDDSTVVITFPEPSLPTGPDLLGRVPIVPEHIWSTFDDVINTINDNPIGTGPFTLGTFTPQSYVMEKNENYWQEGKPALDSIRYVAFNNSDAGLSALLDGDLDWTTGQRNDFDETVDADPDLWQIDTPLNQTTFIACSNAELGCEGPQTDPAVRLAINYGIDRSEIIDVAFDGKGGAVSPTLMLVDRDGDWIAPDLTQESPATADQARAAQILEDAGWEVGSDGIREKNGERLSVKVQVPQDWTGYVTTIELAGQQLAEIGVELTAEKLPGNEYSENRFPGKFQFTMDGVYQGPAPDPFYIYSNYLRSSGTAPVGEQASTNYSRFANPEVDALIERARTSLDVEEKRSIYFDIQRTLVEAIPYVPVLVVPTVTYYRTDNAVGWPEEGSLYALPATWSVWNNGVVVANLKPATD